MKNKITENPYGWRPISIQMDAESESVAHDWGEASCRFMCKWIRNLEWNFPVLYQIWIPLSSCVVSISTNAHATIASNESTFGEKGITVISNKIPSLCFREASTLFLPPLLSQNTSDPPNKSFRSHFMHLKNKFL